MESLSKNIIIYLLQKFFNSEKKKTIIMITLSIIINVLQVAVISQLSAGIINAVQNSVTMDIFRYFKYFIIISLIYVVTYYIYKLIQLQLLSKLRHWLKSELIEMILRVNNDKELQQMNIIDLNTPISRISAASFLVLNNFISYNLPNLVLLFVILTYFAYTNFSFGLLFCICNIIIILVIYYRFDVITKSNAVYEDSLNENEKGLIEILNNMDKIIQRGENNSETSTFNLKIKHTIDSSIDFYTKSNKETTIAILLLNITLFVNIGYIILLFLQKKIDVKLFITFFTIILVYRERFTSMIQNIPDIVEFIGRVDNITSFFKNTIIDYDQIKNIDKKLKINNLQFNTLSFENVTFSYNQNKKMVLKNFNRQIDLNGIIGILGRSGKGKSTICKLIIKLYKYDGLIRIDNVDIQSIDNNFLRHNIIYIDQNPKMFNRKIIENILYGCNFKEDYCKKQLTYIRSNFSLINEIFNKLDIDNTQSGFLGNNLSGGQKQVLNIVNGLIQDAKIIMIDEPTNSLDTLLKKEVIRLILLYKQIKKAIIVVTHDTELMHILDKKIII